MIDGTKILSLTVSRSSDFTNFFVLAQFTDDKPRVYAARGPDINVCIADVMARKEAYPAPRIHDVYLEMKAGKQPVPAAPAVDLFG